MNNDCLYPDWEGGMTSGNHTFDKDGFCIICGQTVEQIMPKFTENDWNHFHDLILDRTMKSLNKEELQKEFNELPQHLRGMAISWGMSDTNWRDSVIEYYNNQKPKELILG